MTKYTLIYTKDQESGELGFLIEGMKPDLSAASSGDLTAHDLLEHASLPEIGTVEDEIKALGACWFIRGQFGDIRRAGNYHSPETTLANDLGFFGRYFILGENHLQGTPKRIDCVAADTFREVASQARADLLGELEGEEYSQEILEAYIAGIPYFMAKGYNIAAKRYRPIGGAVMANTLFWNVAEAVDKALKWAKIEGQRFTLSINKRRGTAHCEEDYSAYY